MFSTILSVLTNPAVDSALVSAASSLVSYISGLSEQDRAKVIAQVDAYAAATVSGVAEDDADLAATQAILDALKAKHHAEIDKTFDAVKAQLAARVAP